MSALAVERYCEPTFQHWNAFVERSNEGTLYHRLDFLAYHGERFAADVHHLVWREHGAPMAVMPMALAPNETRVARSPYGASYGGPAFAEPPGYATSLAWVRSLLEHLQDAGAEQCVLTLPINCCYRVYTDTFRLALHEAGFRCVRREVSSAVCLDDRLPAHEPVACRAGAVLRRVRRAERHGIIGVHRAPPDAFWAVLEQTFGRHQAKPTHTRQELEWLCDRLPDRVWLDVAYEKDRPVAGVAVFLVNDRTACSFYLCADPERRQTQALTLLLVQAMALLRERHIGWLDFGTSSDAMRGRDSIFRFKEGFGAVGLFRETYEWRANGAIS